ncbi:MAG: fibronectin type III domain-containing protein [Deltaproteobacteria bacterium]|nr:fibronectin type III domain-containing protein [Deltaproteobacteria bacterium]
MQPRQSKEALLLGFAALLVASACDGSGEIEEPISDGAETSSSLANPVGHLVATAEAITPGERPSGTYLQTQAQDGVPELLREGRRNSLQATWTVPLGGASGNHTLKLVARRAAASGDDFYFGWSTSFSGPFTRFCTLTAGDTAYKTCRQALSIAPGTASVFVRVTDSIARKDDTANAIEVDYLALISFDCSACVPAACQTASVCNANEMGCTVTPAVDGTACTNGTCNAGICVGATDLCAGVACAAGESCHSATGACECAATSCPAGSICSAEKRCVQSSSETTVLVGNPAVESTEDWETVGDADAFEYTSGAQAGKASKINVYTAAGNQAAALQVALYADNAGVPGAMLAGSSCTISMPAGVAGWFGCALSDGPQLSPSTKYWMAALSTSGEFHWRAQDGSRGRYSYSTGKTSLPSTWNQTGTYAGYARSAYVEGAVTSSAVGTAELSWDAPTTLTDGSPLTDLTGYRIYYGTSSGSYSTIVNLTDPAMVTYTLSNLPSGATYFFAVTALSAAGGESAYSAEASKLIP